jgi:radical SAM protein with 4Fe4S-binding SPASM domain
VAQRLAEAGVRKVELTGGEPLARPDFWSIVDCLVASGIRITRLYTNGSLIDSAFFDSMLMRGLRWGFVVSFDGVGCHDWLRGSSGQEEKAIAVIKAVIDHGYPVAATTTVHAGSTDALPATYELMKSLGVNAWKVGHCDDEGAWHKGGHKALSDEALYGAYEEVLQKYLADGSPMGLQLGIAFGGKKGGPGRPLALRNGGEDEPICGACLSSPSIMSDGRLIPCSVLAGSSTDKDMPNILDKTLGEIYADTAGPFMRLAALTAKERLDNNAKCQYCEYRLQCAGGKCFINIYESGNTRQEPLLFHEEVCRFFKNGWKDRFERLIKQ